MLPGCPRATDWNWRITSNPDDAYNCFAHALHDCHHFIWPDPEGQLSWPDDLKREDTVACIVEFLMRLEFSLCDNYAREPNIQKIAIYTKGGEPTHLARQTADGQWTSKMATGIDIVHTDLAALEDGELGRATVFLKRIWKGKPKLPPLNPPAATIVTVTGAPLSYVKGG